MHDMIKHAIVCVFVSAPIAAFVCVVWYFFF